MVNSRCMKEDGTAMVFQKFPCHTQVADSYKNENLPSQFKYKSDTETEQLENVSNENDDYEAEQSPRGGGNIVIESSLLHNHVCDKHLLERQCLSNKLKR
nr:unnamed protein product [Callosobruchus analis]